MKKRQFLILILLLVIGFASVTTTLVLNGKVGIGVELDDFDVIFIEALLDGKEDTKANISEDKKTITFSTDKFINVGDGSRLDYKVKNTSTQYNADVEINCTNEANEYVNVTSSFDGNQIPLANPVNIKAQEVKSGYINAELIKSYTGEDTSIEIKCTINVTATSRENYAYTINFDSDGGSEVGDKVVIYDKEYGVLEEPVREGYTFLGWYDEEDNKIDNTTILSSKGHKTLKAKWKYICPYAVGKTWDFNYTGGEQTFTTPCDGEYKLETWGAEGGSGYYNQRGYGGYSRGTINLKRTKKLFINVGEKGESVHVAANVNVPGGYNGGGDGNCAYDSRNGNILSGASGGGATHIATVSGELYTLEKHKDTEDILIVAGGGGGTSGWHINGWVTTFSGYLSGGGFKSNTASASNSGGGRVTVPGATQTSGYAFGRANPQSANVGSGGGGGWYGGGSHQMVGTGGSGYIGNSLLTNKAMYCYSCETSNEESTKTISTNNVSTNPISNYSKQGNGYAKITLVSID